MRSKIPVLARVRATTIPPNSSANGPPAVLTAAMTSSSLRILNPNNTLTPSSAATAMSITSKAIARMTAPNTANVMYICSSVMLDSRLTDGRGVHQTAVRPEPIQAAFEMEWAVSSEIPFEHLAIVTDALDGP